MKSARPSNPTFTAFDEHRPHCLAIQLHHAFNTPQVFWSSIHNSYVVNDCPTGWWTAPDGTPCDLYSVNGMGETRWLVSSEKGGTPGDLEAAKYFGLTWHGYRGDLR